ncbi:hypothetical protein HMI54_012352 [Coelomomyces lativittatus]|nr:hypothetical protein HMI54_012352 [Coelomomyces lativittatus]
MIRIHIPNVQKNGFKIITGPDPTSIEWFGTQIDKVFKKYVYDTRPIERKKHRKDTFSDRSQCDQDTLYVYTKMEETVMSK